MIHPGYPVLAVLRSGGVGRHRGEHILSGRPPPPLRAASGGSGCRSRPPSRLERQPSRLSKKASLRRASPAHRQLPRGRGSSNTDPNGRPGDKGRRTPSANAGSRFHGGRAMSYACLAVLSTASRAIRQPVAAYTHHADSPPAVSGPVPHSRYASDLTKRRRYPYGSISATWMPFGTGG